MTDASPAGYGVVSRKALLEKIRQEARWGERRGWLVNVDALYTVLETRSEEDEDEGVRMGAVPVTPDAILGVSADLRMSFYTCSVGGSERTIWSFTWRP